MMKNMTVTKKFMKVSPDFELRLITLWNNFDSNVLFVYKHCMIKLTTLEFLIGHILFFL